MGLTDVECEGVDWIHRVQQWTLVNMITESYLPEPDDRPGPHTPSLLYSRSWPLPNPITGGPPHLG